MEMKTPLPRRNKDLLAALDSDEDTPIRPQRAQVRATAIREINKDAGRGKENEPHPNIPMQMIPRRASEMMMMNSDSEEEDSKSNQNLNCAILNDSFVLSPTHELTGSTGTMTTSGAPLKAGDSNLSFLGRFGNMGIDCSSQASPGPAPDQVPFSKKAPPPSVKSIAERRQLLDTETPLRKSSNSSAVSVAVAKSQAKPDKDFVTPQVRAFSSTQAVKSRAPVGSEFRSQKVLFQTPMTVSRAAPFPRENISFSLCDTINESPDIPEPKKEEPALGKSKKSLETVFTEAEKKLPKPEDIEPPKELAVVAVDPKPSSQASATSKAGNRLKINNREYVIVKKLGCGGSSSVYMARRSDSADEVALKVVDLQADPVVVQGYLNETKLLAKLQGHACVVSLYDYQLLRDELKLYMVMEKGDCDLNKILQSYTTNLPLYSLVNILYQMLQAVNYIHQNGVIHSDLKPANFLMVNGRLKLIDFGIASNIAVDSTSIIKFSQAGTFNYISPEALTDTSTGNSPMRRGNQPKIKISTKSDVWSLGCILYLLIYQKTPFGHIRNVYAKMSAIASPATSIDFPAIPLFYPVMLIHMVKNCLQLNPKNRPSCHELLQYPFHMLIPLQNLQIPARTAGTATKN